MSDWTQITLKELARNEPRSFIDGDWIEAPYITTEGNRLIQTGNIGVGCFIGANEKFISDNTFVVLRCKEVRPGDVLICRLADPIGRACIAPDLGVRCITSVDVCILRVDERRFDKCYVVQRINQDDFLERCKEVSGGTTRQRISRTNLGNLQLDLPPLPQQRKIARILTTVDNLIEKTEALIAKYQAIKQGMMHDLFTRGVDEHGHLRPPYEQAPELYKQSELGWIPKEWDCLSFGNFIVAGPQNGLYKPMSSYSVDGSPIVRIDGFYDGQLCDTRSFRRLHVTRAELAVYTLEADDILVNRVNSIDYVGKSAIVPELREATVYESNIMRLKVHRERLLPDFAIRLLCHYTVQHQFRQSAKSAVAQASINQSDIRRCVVAIPQLKEQVCLVECCRSFDRHVDCERNYLEKLHLQKTGLMQDLLTGKVRVTADEAEDVTTHA